MKKLIILGLFAVSCTPDAPFDEQQKNKTGCVCNDGTRIVWNENMLKQTSSLTGNPCYDKGGIKEYIYN